MQERKHGERRSEAEPGEEKLRVPLDYWNQLKGSDLTALCRRAEAVPHPPQGLKIQYLHRELLVHLSERSLFEWRQGHWEVLKRPHLELLTLVYLLNVSPEPIAKEWVGPQQLKEGHFFRGPHTLKSAPILKRFGNDLVSFKKAAERIGGERGDLADAAYKFSPFPKIPLLYLLWQGDEEFGPRLSILFDRSIERHLSADAIWGITNLVSDELLLHG